MGSPLWAFALRYRQTRIQSHKMNIRFAIHLKSGDCFLSESAPDAVSAYVLADSLARFAIATGNGDAEARIWVADWSLDREEIYCCDQIESLAQAKNLPEALLIVREKINKARNLELQKIQTNI